MRARHSGGGFSLIELMIAITVLAVALGGAAAAWNTAMTQGQLMREEAVALRAAEEVLATIQGTDYDILTPPNWVEGRNVGGWLLAEASAPSLAREAPFEVSLVAGHSPRMGLEYNGTAQAEGEVIIIMNENPQEGDYGRDLDGDGSSDGVDIDSDGSLSGVPVGSIFPLDLNGDGDATDDLSADPNSMVLIPVVVLVRWQSLGGKAIQGRLQLMTVVRK